MDPTPVMQPRRTAVALAVLALVVVLAGCGGSSSGSRTTASAAPAQTTTADGRPTTLTAAQAARFDKASKAFISASVLFLTEVNQCVPKTNRGPCVKRAADKAERVVTRTRDAVSALAGAVGGACAAQLGDVRAKIADVTGALGPMAEATQSGKLRNAARLGTDAQGELRSYATSSQIVQRAC